VKRNLNSEYNALSLIFNDLTYSTFLHSIAESKKVMAERFRIEKVVMEDVDEIAPM
jgi:hypothetical protein